MIQSAPQIGFDRYIQLDWMAMAIKVRAGLATLDDLETLLDSAGLGKEAKSKTRTKLNALAIEPRNELVAFIDRGVEIFSPQDDCAMTAVFAWGSAIASYPYFGKVAEFSGRLTAIQGDCSVSEIHRRMSEVYGDREVTKRATQAVIQTQANWGAIERVENGKRLNRPPQRKVSDEKVIRWLVEAALRFMGKAMPVTSLPTMAVIYPFQIDQSLPYVLSKSDNIELRAEGPSNQFAALRS
ncbi:hypothetical protein [Massilia brevitalea]|uniref:hypothetical protein n=1 Tax=Massilia brevitalea TaxID=442526 RepID=UPI002738DE2C|nr:hypothetical protein [Massilia brevitalea]